VGEINVSVTFDLPLFSKRVIIFCVNLIVYEVEEQHDVWSFRYNLVGELVTALKEGKSCDLTIFVILLVPKGAIIFRSLPEDRIRNKRFLEEQIQCDFSLVAVNGVMLPCHKLFLAGCFSILYTPS